MQRLVRSIGETYRDYIKADAPVSSRWHNYFVALMSDRYDAAMVAYNALAEDTRADWLTEATAAAPVLNTQVDYAASGSPDAGFLALLAAHTVYSGLGDPEQLGSPRTSLEVGNWMKLFG